MRFHLQFLFMGYSIIITAAGKGLRMGTDVPKQFLLINGQPILFHTIQRFYEYDPTIQIIVVLPEDQIHIDHWLSLVHQHEFEIPHETVSGGETRFHSIKNGLAFAKGQIIGVHDGVRPFVSHEVIANCYREAEKSGACIPVLPVKESLRKINGALSKAVDRSAYRKVQTPQCFEVNLLKKSYEQAYQSFFTDDASVVEANGHHITVVNGNEENIKITSPFDLKLAEVLIG